MAIDPSFLDELKELDFILRKKVSDVYMGGRPSIQYGKGIEPVDHREYLPGDDFRMIDWKVYGRTEKLYVRRFEEEKSLILHILVDSSASMNFSVQGMNKFDYAGSIAVGFGYMSINDNEKFATALYGENMREVIPPNKSRAYLFRIIDLLNDMRPYGETNLGLSASQYSKMIKAKSYVVIISDFIEPLQSLREGISRMAKHAKELLLIQVLDPGEINLEWTDDVRFEDLESNETMRTYLSPNFKSGYEKRVTEHIYAVNEICDDFGVDFVSLRTDKPIFDSFVELVGGLKRGG